MPASTPWASRVDKVFDKTITFSNAAGLGAQGTVAVATVTGAVLITLGAVLCTTDLTGASATIEMGVAGNTAALIAQTTATSLDAGQFWQDASPEAGVSPAITNKNVYGNIIITVGTANLTAGVITIRFFWRPITAGAGMA